MFKSKPLKNVFNPERLEAIENCYNLPKGTLTKTKLNKGIFKRKQKYVLELCTTLCSLTAVKLSIENPPLSPFDNLIEFELGGSPYDCYPNELEPIENAIDDVIKELSYTCGHAA